MTNQQLYLAIGIPAFFAFINIAANLTLILRLDTKVESLRTEIANELRAIRSDINTITKMYGEHGERIARVEAKN